MAGDYYLQVAVVPSSYSGQQLFEIPYVLDIDVVGEPGKGPELTGQGAVEDRNAADPGTAAEPSDGGGADSSDMPDLEDAPTMRRPPGSRCRRWCGSCWEGSGGGILLAALTIGAVVLVRRVR